MPDPAFTAQWTEAMRDRGRFWEAVPDFATATLAGDGWTGRRVDGLTQWLISGDLNAFAASNATAMPSVGFWQVEASLPTLLRIGRDRALVVGENALDLRPGWNGAGYAASDVSDGWAALEVEGAIADIVSELTFADPGAQSPSASVLAVGLPALIYRRADTVMRIHVEAPSLNYLWQWLAARRG